MHSLLILGDVRTHQITVAETGEWLRVKGYTKWLQPLQFTLPGGVHFMRKTIEDALGSLKLSSPPKLLGCKAWIPNERQGEILKWELGPREIRFFEAKQFRARLKPQGVLASVDTPLLEDPLEKILSNPKSLFPKSSNHEDATRGMCPDIIVLNDLGNLLRQKVGSKQNAVADALARLRDRLDAAERKRSGMPVMEPVIIAAIQERPHELPELFDNDTIWSHLYQSAWLRARTIILLDADTLRRSGLSISTGLSWERTAQDTIIELRRSRHFRRFLSFGQVIVRFGITGALHLSRAITGELSVRLHFDCRHNDTAGSLVDVDGVLPGFSSIFVASLVKQLTNACHDQNGTPHISELNKAVDGAIWRAVCRCQIYQMEAFAKSFEAKDFGTLDNCIPSKLFEDERLKKWKGNDKSAKDPECTPVPLMQLNNWSILAQTAQTRVGAVARQIVKIGAVQVLNTSFPADEKDELTSKSNELSRERGTALANQNERLSGPFVVFGKQPKQKDEPSKQLVVVDREEIEGYRTILNLMASHVKRVQDGTNERPLSIAVFGPPGSGKSLAVKKMNESLDDDGKATSVLEPFNLAQCTGVSDLEASFDRIQEEVAKSKIPIAFFDEFDCAFAEGKIPWGWLKYFLAPMEDGVFRGKTIKDAILVFAGGMSSTYENFSLAGRSSTDPLSIAFAEAKGPDFVSRLRGHLNIIGINRSSLDDELYLIRRAVLIRSLLCQIQKLSGAEEARIHPDLLRAFVHVPEYKHGGRAVRMLLDLCTSNDDEKSIALAQVPPMHQLDMFVDGKAFMDLVRNVSAEPT